MSMNLSNFSFNLNISSDVYLNLSECLNLIVFQGDYNHSCWTDLDIAYRNLSELQVINKFNSTSDSSEPRPFVPQLWIQILWALLFGLMVLGAVMGNIMVIWIILGHKLMRTKTNIFLLNLSLADLMMATLNAMFNFLYMIKSHWPFGWTYCMVSNFAANMANGLSVFTITATSIDRYVVVMHPLKPRITKKGAAFVVALIWISAFLLALPALLYSRTFTIKYNDGERRVLCTLQWPDGVSGLSESDYIYNIIYFVVTYVVPMISMAVTYSLMSRTLCRNEHIGEATETQRMAIRSKQRVVPMLIAVTVVFGICWLPYHVYFIYTYHRVEVTQSEYVQHIFLACYWLAMFNSLANPIIYCLLNKRCVHSSKGKISAQPAYHTMCSRFKAHFKQILSCSKAGNPAYHKNRRSTMCTNVWHNDTDVTGAKERKRPNRDSAL